MAVYGVGDIREQIKSFEDFIHMQQSARKMPKCTSQAVISGMKLTFRGLPQHLTALRGCFVRYETSPVNNRRGPSWLYRDVKVVAYRLCHA